MKICRQVLLTAVLTILFSCPVFAKSLTVYDVSSARDNNVYTQVNYFTSLLPTCVSNKLASAGWLVYIVDDASASIGAAASSTLAVCVPAQRSIILSASSSESDAVLHELGHAIDSYLNYPSISETFKLIYLNDVTKFAKTHLTAQANIATCTEYFAEAFQEYVQNPDYLNTSCPITYNYMKAIVSCFE